MRRATFNKVLWLIARLDPCCSTPYHRYSTLIPQDVNVCRRGHQRAAIGLVKTWLSTDEVRIKRIDIKFVLYPGKGHIKWHSDFERSGTPISPTVDTAVEHGKLHPRLNLVIRGEGEKVGFHLFPMFAIM